MVYKFLRLFLAKHIPLHSCFDKVLSNAEMALVISVIPAERKYSQKMPKNCLITVVGKYNYTAKH